MSRENPDTPTSILNAAWRLLESGEAAGVRMSDIARAAGVSRQAVYLHFPTRGELLVATTRHIDVVKDVNRRLAASRNAKTGRERLDAFIEAWGNYIPEIHGIARALMAMQDSDAAAADAWADRMQALREGCEAAVAALERDGDLAAGLSAATATDVLWALLSVETWERLTRQCGWSQGAYVEGMQRLAARGIVEA